MNNIMPMDLSSLFGAGQNHNNMNNMNMNNMMMNNNMNNNNMGGMPSQQNFVPTRFFAKGIRIVYNNNNNENANNMNKSNNSNNGNSNGDDSNGGNSIPHDLEVATQYDLVMGQPILLVPQEMILTGSKARNEVGHIPQAEELLRDNNNYDVNEDPLPYFYLMVKLLHECERGSKSYWYHWLDSLPWYISNGSCLTEACCDLLPSLVAQKVKQELNRFRRFFAALAHATCLAPHIRSDEALAKWAFGIVYTRSISNVLSYGGMRDVLIIPNADMFNHGTMDASIELQTDSETGNCLAVATRNVPGGSPLRRIYERNSNIHSSNDSSFLFARYGFVDEEAPAIFCMLIIDNPTDDLLAIGYNPSKMLFSTRDGDVSQQVYDVVLYHCVIGGKGSNANSSNPKHQKAFLKAHSTGDNSSKKKIHTKYYTQTVRALMEHVDSILGEIDACQDKTLCADESLHPRLALVVKHNVFLKQVFLRVRGRLSQKL